MKTLPPMPALNHPMTVAEFLSNGFMGLRIPRCPDCRIPTWRSWSELEVQAEEDVVDVARRLFCSSCCLPPAGLAVVATTGQ